MPDIKSLKGQTGSTKGNTDVKSSDELTEELVVVASFNFRQDADLAMTFLIAKEIEVFESPDDCGGWDPGLGFGTRTRLLVNKSNAAKAIALLDEIEGL